MDPKSLDKKYLDFIENMLSQTAELIPKDVNKLQQDYLVTNMRKSSMMLAQSMQDEDTFKKLNFESQCTYLQIMAEWSFHKEIDLFRSGIPAKYWKSIMLKIWATMWDVMYACIENDASEELLLSIIEKYVNKAYLEAIAELKYSNIIDENIEEQAKEQSNIKLMAIDLKKQQDLWNHIKKIIILLVVGVFVGAGVTFAVLKYKILGINLILISVIIFNIIVEWNNRKN